MGFTVNIKAIVNKIKQNDKQYKPILIGIEGFGGSGKTTFANKLKEALGSTYVVNIDDFIVKEKLSEPSWDSGGFDRQRLEKQVLIPAKNHQLVSYQELVWATNELSSPKVVPSVDYLIVEGISSYHPDIAHYYDYTIWIDTAIEIANERGHVRDGSIENEQYWELWAKNDLNYKEKYHPEQVADFTIDNS